MKLSIVVSIFGAAQLVVSIPVRLQNGPQNLDTSQSSQQILHNSEDNPAYTYPSDLTRDIIPKPIHSHNDYWRDIPFLSALSVGCESVEADVWLYDGILYVGHQEQALTPQRTFDSLYIQPILNVLNRQNQRGLIIGYDRKNGVFDAASDQTLYLFVDVKTDGATTWPHVVQALEPLRKAGYLTRVNGTTMIPGPVTVIGTGETPLDQIEGVTERDYFFDANAALLNTTQAGITSLISPIASAEFPRYVGVVKGTTFTGVQLANLRAQISMANSKGIGLRYWDTPGFPISTRNAVWRTLLDEGVALINADDLPAAAGFTGSGW